MYARVLYDPSENLPLIDGPRRREKERKKERKKEGKKETLVLTT